MEGSFAENKEPMAETLPTSRPRRKAAENALTAIAAVQMWESLPKNSPILQQVAAAIDAEMSDEVQNGRVRLDELVEEDKPLDEADLSTEAVGNDVIDNVSRKEEEDDEEEYYSAVESEDCDSESEYDSSFVTSDDEDDENSEGEWIPNKKKKAEEQ